MWDDPCMCGGRFGLLVELRRMVVAGPCCTAILLLWCEGHGICTDRSKVRGALSLGEGWWC
jgi:hypothetical protein